MITNILDANEIDNSVFVCNGQSGSNGLTTLVKATVEPNGVNCMMGGYKIETGLDINSNRILDPNESTNSIFVCDGQDNFLTYVAIVSQTGTSTPQSTIIKNTLDLNIAWARISQGKFKGILSENVDLSKTVVLNNNIQVNCKFISSSEITLENTCGVNAFCDDFSNLTLEIKSFN